MDEIKKFQQFFESEQGDKCLARLYMHAHSLLQRYRRGAVKNLDLEADDVVSKTILLVLDGSRRWNSTKDPDIEKYLKFNIRSVIDHSFNTVKSVKTQSFSENKEVNEFVPSLVKSKIDDYTESLQSPSIEDLILSDEEFSMFSAKILEGFGEYPQLEEIVLCISEGICKPREIAEELKISISEVNNRKKRLKGFRQIFYDKP